MVCCYYNSSGERIKGVKDSKLVIKKTQRSLFKQLTKKGQFVVVPATVNAIERDGIYVARNHAVIAAVNLMLMSMKHSKIDTSNVTVLLDGYWSQNWILIFERLCGVKFEGVINGDAKIYEISAASIVARVYIDALFEGYNHFWPGYNINNNHGSPDQIMYRKLRKNGPSPIFRVKNYAPGWWKNIMEGKAKTGKDHGRRKGKKRS